MNKQWRIVGLGDYANYYSYFTAGILHGSVQAGAWFRPVSLFGQSLDSVKEQVNFFKPHIILAHMIFNKKPHDQNQVFDMLRGFRKQGIKIGYHMGDARTDPRYPGDISDIVDFSLVNNLIGDHFSSIWKVPCYHWPYGCMSQSDIMNYDIVSPIYKGSIAFTGSLNTQPGHVHYERTMFVEKIRAAGIDIKLYPNPSTGNTRFQTAEMSSGCDGILGVGMAEHIPGYLDVRPFQYIGAGALYYHNFSPIMDKFFEADFHYIAYDKMDSKSFVRKSRINFQEKMKIRHEGFKFCQRYHSMKERVEFVINLIDGKVDKPKIYLEDLN